MLSFAQPLFAKEDNQILDLPLDQLANVDVVSASRFKQKSSEAPSAVEVLTAENIKSFGWRTLADALNSIRGLYIRNDRNYSYLGNRGFSRPGDYDSRVLIMIDGRRMNDSIFDSGFIAEEFLLDMNVIERIEYIPGSGSSVYGANALLGVVNVITKSGKDFNGTRLAVEGGSLGTYRGRATYGKKWDNGAELLLNGSHFFSHGNDRLFFPEFSEINSGIAQDKDQERNYRTFGKFSYGDFTLRGGYINRYKAIPTGSFGSLFNDKANYSYDNQGYIDLDYLKQLNSDLGLEMRVYHHWYDYHAISAYETNSDRNDENSALVRNLSFEGADGRWWGGEFKLTGTQFAHHKWISGLELQYDQRQHFNTYSLNPNIPLCNPTDPTCNTKNNGWRAGLYVQDEYRITNSLLINAGLRLDYHHFIKELQFNPRIGLIWDITPSFTTKLIYGSAFRAPNFFERNVSTFSTTNKPKEELIKSYEAVAEWYPGGGLKLLGTLFYNDITKVLVYNGDTFNTVNEGEFHTLGFELEAEKQWDNGRQFKLSWTYNNTQDRSFSTSSWATDSPRHLVKAHYAEPLLYNKLRLGFEEIFVDERRTSQNNVAPSYHLLNINLALTKPIAGFQASLGVYNVLDQQYKAVADSNVVPEDANYRQDTLAMDGRTVRFRVEYGF